MVKMYQRLNCDWHKEEWPFFEWAISARNFRYSIESSKRREPKLVNHFIWISKETDRIYIKIENFKFSRCFVYVHCSWSLYININISMFNVRWAIIIPILLFMQMLSTNFRLFHLSYSSDKLIIIRKIVTEMYALQWLLSFSSHFIILMSFFVFSLSLWKQKCLF